MLTLTVTMISTLTQHYKGLKIGAYATAVEAARARRDHLNNQIIKTADEADEEEEKEEEEEEKEEEEEEEEEEEKDRDDPFWMPSDEVFEKSDKSQTGYKGISYQPKSSKPNPFRPSYKINNKTVSLGRCPTLLEAAQARRDALKKHLKSPEHSSITEEVEVEVEEEEEEEDE